MTEKMSNKVESQFKIIEENIKDNKKRELFYKKISNKELNEKEKIEELLTEGVIIEEELTFAKSVYYGIEYKKTDTFEFNENITTAIIPASIIIP